VDPAEPMFATRDRVATGLLEVTDDLAALDRAGFWALAITFEGAVTAARFADVRPGPPPLGRPWCGPDPHDWSTSLERTAYRVAVNDIKRLIAAGDVYQVNLCRVLSAALPDPQRADVAALWGTLERNHPAPYSAVLRLPDHGVAVASASPELYLRRRGSIVESGPIKGTARTGADLGEKDRAENVMIVDLVRNDLSRVCEVGTVTVPQLCVQQSHPGLVHLVSTVRGRLAASQGWPQLIAATFPPGSVSGAPKQSALQIIGTLETRSRGPYCGAFGWVDSRNATAELAVGIRTFWVAGGRLHFGTGAGITWGSDPESEWLETELKALRLLALAAGEAGCRAGGR
jgi:para-aminobenzoate synthetase component I